MLKGRFGHARNVVPISSYAQYVLKATVAMGPRALLVTSDEAVVPKPGDLDVHVPVLKPPGLLAWIQQHVVPVGSTVVLLVLAVLAVALRGLRLALNAVFKRSAGNG